jgi:peptidoglycan/LPS O-acetylase OafA/YrhL
MALVVLWITWRHVPESRGASAAAGSTGWGALLATAGLGGMVYAFIEAPVQGWLRPRCWRRWSSASWPALGFVAVERAIAAPLLPLGLFRIATSAAPTC